MHLLMLISNQGFLGQLVQGDGLERCVEGGHFAVQELLQHGNKLAGECPFEWELNQFKLNIIVPKLNEFSINLPQNIWCTRWWTWLAFWRFRQVHFRVQHQFHIQLHIKSHHYRFYLKTVLCFLSISTLPISTLSVWLSKQLPYK